MYKNSQPNTLLSTEPLTNPLNLKVAFPDKHCMDHEQLTATGVILILISIMGLVSIASFVASWIKGITALHDLKVRVAELRRERLEQLANLPVGSQKSV